MGTTLLSAGNFSGPYRGLTAIGDTIQYVNSFIWEALRAKQFSAMAHFKLVIMLLVDHY